ncbi:MAG TPA: hypothetical protein VN857_02915 [Chthoniobacterales bacterium]|nr:hypothetical protein [Chthoniobacterales bacterium]
MRSPDVILFVTPQSYTRDRRTVPEDWEYGHMLLLLGIVVRNVEI